MVSRGSATGEECRIWEEKRRKRVPSCIGTKYSNLTAQVLVGAGRVASGQFSVVEFGWPASTAGRPPTPAPGWKARREGPGGNKPVAKSSGRIWGGYKLETDPPREGIGLPRQRLTRSPSRCTPAAFRCHDVDASLAMPRSLYRKWRRIRSSLFPVVVGCASWSPLGEHCIQVESGHAEPRRDRSHNRDTIR